MFLIFVFFFLIFAYEVLSVNKLGVVLHYEARTKIRMHLFPIRFIRFMWFSLQSLKPHPSDVWCINFGSYFRFTHCRENTSSEPPLSSPPSPEHILVSTPGSLMPTENSHYLLMSLAPPVPLHLPTTRLH